MSNETESIKHGGFTYWYQHRLARHKIDYCLATTDPKEYCNGYYLYSSKDPGNGNAFVIVDTDDPDVKPHLQFDTLVTLEEIQKAKNFVENIEFTGGYNESTGSYKVYDADLYKMLATHAKYHNTGEGLDKAFSEQKYEDLIIVQPGNKIEIHGVSFETEYLGAVNARPADENESAYKVRHIDYHYYWELCEALEELQGENYKVLQIIDMKPSGNYPKMHRADVLLKRRPADLEAKVLNAIEMQDALLSLGEGRTMHCILPEHYEELCKTIMTLINNE